MHHSSRPASTLKCFMCKEGELSKLLLITRADLTRGPTNGLMYIVCEKCEMGRFTHSGQETTWSFKPLPTYPFTPEPSEEGATA